MMKRMLLTTAASFLFVLSASAAGPNIIYILADDMGVGDVKAYNQDCKFPTPNLDRLAADGMRFTDAHSNSSVCTPTRYGIMTGRYCWRTSKKRGVTGGLSPHLINPNRETVASLLKKQGYNTACIGKWHLGMDWSLKDGTIASDKSSQNMVDLKAKIKQGPNEIGFNYFFGIPASANHSPHSFIENGYVQGELEFLGENEKKAAGIQGKPGLVAKGFKQSEILPTFTHRTCEWVTKQVETNPGQPFFVYMPLNSPHSPIVPSPKFEGKSGLSPHGDFCMETDWAVGEVMNTIDRLGITDNTIIIFTADNGSSPMAKFELMQAQGHYPSFIYRGLKGMTWEGGHRVPFIVRWPVVVKGGTVSEQLICTTDLMATIADVNGVTLANNVGEDSVSFLPALKSENVSDGGKRGVVHHSDSGVFAMRSGKWKLLLDDVGGSRRSNPKDKPVIDSADIILFDMENDERETKNLSQKYPEVVEAMKKQLADYVNNGRSTPGMPVVNDAGGKSWVELWPLKDYLNEVSLAEMGTRAPQKEQTQPEEQRLTTEEVKAARKAARKAQKANANNSK